MSDQKATEPLAAEFAAIGTTNRILVTAGSSLPAAIELAKGHLAELDKAVSRFRADSEVSRLARMSEDGEAWYFGSALFNDHLEAARHAARISGGLVDFTVGSAVIASGYDADLDTVRVRGGYSLPTRPVKAPGWERVVRGGGGRVSTPRGTVLDFGATAKAHAADTIAGLLAAALPGGFLVNLGGDIATAGPAPEGGWRVGVEAADGGIRQVIAITDQGVATSSTQLRRWQTDGGTAHHIVDPRTGRTAAAVWAHVTCVASSALEANTASTASIVLGEEAPAWLGRHHLAARLERPDGSVVHTADWPLP
ncbi:MAG TPA: FAD:protein FMN transferase [Propionicimonas sp.]|uniref:FAD:protein FMN transferase n=1 Tax=Propionicimonas sp. TaxID=1955623 RepID=UPI002F3ED9FE